MERIHYTCIDLFGIACRIYYNKTSPKWELLLLLLLLATAVSDVDEKQASEWNRIEQRVVNKPSINNKNNDDENENTYFRYKRSRHRQIPFAMCKRVCVCVFVSESIAVDEIE